MHRNAKGFSHVDYAYRGDEVTSFEPGPHLTNGAPAEVALGFLRSNTDDLGDVAFLRFLGGELGIYLPREEAEGEPPAAALTC